MGTCMCLEQSIHNHPVVSPPSGSGSRNPIVTPPLDSISEEQLFTPATCHNPYHRELFQDFCDVYECGNNKVLNCEKSKDLVPRYHFKHVLSTIQEVDEGYDRCIGSTSPNIFAGADLERTMSLLKMVSESQLFYLLFRIYVGNQRRQFHEAPSSKVREVFDITEQTISKKRWRRGWFSLGAYSHHLMVTKTVQLTTEFAELPVGETKSVLRFLYRFLPKDGATMNKDDAISIWKPILDRKWPLLQDWCTYLQVVCSKKERVTADQWDLLPDFAKVVTDWDVVAQYNEVHSCWPTLMDSFMVWLKNRGCKEVK